MDLSDWQVHILRALAAGLVLKVHRTMDGEKVCRLHEFDGNAIEEIEPEAVQALVENHLIDSNKKFPAASFLLTEKGRALAEQITGRPVSALGADNYVQE